MKATKKIQINEIVKELEKIEISPIDKQIYDLVYKITQVRKQKNMTQKQLAEKAGLSHNTISRIETFITTPSLPILISLTNALDMTLDLKNYNNIQS